MRQKRIMYGIKSDIIIKYCDTTMEVRRVFTKEVEVCYLSPRIQTTNRLHHPESTLDLP